MESEGKQNPGTLRLQFPCGWITFRHSSRACDNRGAQTRRWKYGQGYEGGNEFKTKQKKKMMFTVCLKTSSGSGIFIGGCWFNDPMMSRDWPLVTNSNWFSCWVTLTLVLESSITTDTLLMFCIVSMATSYSLSDRMLPKQIINKKKGQTFHRQKNKTTKTKRGPSWPTESK